MKRLQARQEFSHSFYIVSFASFTILSLIVILFLLHESLTIETSAAAENSVYTPCNCAIFRLDDVNDGNNGVVRSAILGHFIDENKKLIAAIIVNEFGNIESDGTVYAKVKEGYEKGLFELAIHGWNHIRYSELTEQQQKQDFTKANNKLLSLFGNKSRIFIPPFNAFSPDTIKAMAESGLDTLSTSYFEEDKTSNPYKLTNPFVTNNSKIQLSQIKVNNSDSMQIINKTIYHVPYDIALLGLIQSGYSGENLTQKVLSDVNKNIARYGFSVITLHPSDFATFKGNIIDTNKFQILVDIIDRLDTAGISFANFNDVTGHAVRTNKISIANPN
jgi:peptidoglycan/xylan/chitin deacetylase (PgdA/CDA1 family)